MKVLTITFRPKADGMLFDNGKRFIRLMEYPEDDEARYIVARKKTKGIIYGIFDGGR